VGGNAIDTQTERPEDGGTIRAVHRAFAILRAFRAQEQGLSLGEIAQRARLDKATARRLLRTLMAERLIEQAAAGGVYSLGVGVLELAAGVAPAGDLRQRAEPVLAALAEATGGTAFLGVVHEGAAVCVARADGRSAIQVRSWSVGGRLPLHCGAGPRVLLAYLPASEQRRILSRRLEALTPATPVDARRLAALLPRIRERGWEIAVDDVVEGLASVAVPVRDAAGRVIATISVTGLHAQMLQDGSPRHLPAAQEAARRLEAPPPRALVK